MTTNTRDDTDKRGAIGRNRRAIRSRQKPPADRVHLIEGGSLTTSNLSTMVLLVGNLYRTLFANNYKISARVRRKLYAIISRVFYQTKGINYVLINIIKVNAIVVDFFQRRRLIILIYRGYSVSNAMGVNMTLTIARSKVTISRRGNLSGVRAIIVTLRYFTDYLTATKMTRRQGSINVGMKRDRTMTCHVVGTTTLNRPFKIQREFTFTRTMRVRTSHGVTTTNRLGTMILRFFFIIISTVLCGGDKHEHFDNNIFQGVGVRHGNVAKFKFGNGIPSNHFTKIHLWGREANGTCSSRHSTSSRASR